MALIEQLKSSDNKFIKAALKDAPKWARLRHTKKDLELFLAYNIAEIKFRLKDSTKYETIVVTGNNGLINAYSEIIAQNGKNRKQTKHMFFTGIKTTSRDSVMAYDFVGRKLKTISLDSWEIINFISITKDNIEILNQLIQDCLKK